MMIANGGVGYGPDNVQPLAWYSPSPSSDKVQPPAGTPDNAQPPVVGNPDKNADDNTKPPSPDAGDNDGDTGETDGDSSPTEGASDGNDSDVTPHWTYFPVNPIPWINQQKGMNVKNLTRDLAEMGYRPFEVSLHGNFLCIFIVFQVILEFVLQ